MFCPNCGKSVADGAAFCAECGTKIEAPVAAAPIAEAQPAAPAAPAAPVVPVTPVTPVAAPAPVVNYSQPVADTSIEQIPIVKDTLEFIKGFFSPKMQEASGLAVRSTGLQWIIFALLNIIMLSLSDALCFLYAAEQFMVGAFFIRMLVFAITFFTLAGSIFVMTQIAFKKVVPFSAVLNLVAYATIPMTIAAVANMLLGLIPYSPITEFVTAIAVMMTVLILFAEIKKLAPTENTGVASFVAAMAVVVIIYLILGDLLGRIVELPGSLSSLASVFRTAMSVL